MSSFTFTLQCADRPGIVNRVTGVLLDAGANIVESAQFGDPDTGTFTMRTVFDCAESEGDLVGRFGPVGEQLGAQISLRLSGSRPKVLIMVGREEHCLLDLLYRQRSGELAIEIPLIISNHTDSADLAARYGIPFEHVPVTPEAKPEAEAILTRRIDELGIETVVLARYMQILSPDMCQSLEGMAINIHHSFLPGFKGSRPYHQAHARGVKLIGATAHYVTDDLDEGPIITQDVARVTHADSVDEMVRAGRDVERMVLSRAVRYHSEDRVILIGSKTVVFT